MLPGASTIKDAIFFITFSAEAAPATLDLFDFFTELVNLVVDLGVRINFSRLELSSLWSFPLLSAGGRGEGNLGEMGGEIAGLVFGDGSGDSKGGGIRDSWEVFLRNFFCSKLGNWLPVG